MNGVGGGDNDIERGIVPHEMGMHSNEAHGMNVWERGVFRGRRWSSDYDAWRELGEVYISSQM